MPPPPPLLPYCSSSASAPPRRSSPRAAPHCRFLRPLPEFLSRTRRRPPLLVVSSNKNEASFADRILDYIEGGPKLRRWYGAPDLLPKDGDVEDEDDDSSDIGEPRDAVLVTNGESEIGQRASWSKEFRAMKNLWDQVALQMVLLSLILKRARIKALVKDKRSIEEAFGTYVECMVGNVDDKSFMKKALRGVHALICPADEGFFSDLIDLKGVQHIVLLSQLAVYRNSSGLQAIMNSKLRKLAEKDEEVVLSSGIPCTIIRTGSLQSTPGGERGFNFKEGAAAKGRISKEDAAKICVEALDAVPQKMLIFEVANGDEKVSDWKAWFSEQMKTVEGLQ